MHPTRAVLGTVLLVFSSRASVPERIVTNDNRIPAGTLAAGILTVHLEARDGEWHPDADSAPGVVTHAFAIDGEAARIPGPLLRAFLGTEVRAFVHNSRSERLIVHGLNTRGGPAIGDAASVGAGETREIRFTASRVGTFFYWAATDTVALLQNRQGIDTQLYGAIVVDPADAPRPADRWTLHDDARSGRWDSPAATSANGAQRAIDKVEQAIVRKSRSPQSALQRRIKGT